MPTKRNLAHVMIHIGWRGEAIEHELEVSDSVDFSIMDGLLDLAYERVCARLREFSEQLDQEADEDATEQVEPLPTVEQTVDILSLVNVHVTATQAAEWSGRKRLQAVRWASAVHLDASDNDVEIPPMPGFLVTEQRRPDDPALQASDAVLRQAGGMVPHGSAFTVDMSKAPGTSERPWADGSPNDTELSDLPARGGQCRAIVVRQKEHAEVREPCGYQLGTIGEWTSCPNYNNHLRDELTQDPIVEGSLSKKEQLARDYIDRYATAPPENASVEYLREALARD